MTIEALSHPPHEGRALAPLLEAIGLSIRYGLGPNAVNLVEDVSFRLAPGEVLGLVGESGSGKTLTARAIIGLTRANPLFRASGRLIFEGQDLVSLPEPKMRALRGGRIAMIFQDPMTSLNPLHRIGTQIGEMLRQHQPLSPRARRARAIELLAEVGIPNPAARVEDFPHQFSGGMRQRAMIAMALACNPALLIADEPTTALDVTTQAQILDLIDRLRRDLGMAVLLITHDLGVVAGIADRVLVMYAGQVVEEARTRDLFHAPRHPYTRGLLASIPAAHRQRAKRLPSIPGQPPLLTLGRPSGCAFRPRCSLAAEICAKEPPLIGTPHPSRCWMSSDPGGRP